MPHGGPGNAQEPAAPQGLRPLMSPLSDVLPGTYRQTAAPGIHSHSKHKAESNFTSSSSSPAQPTYLLTRAHPHASAIAGSEASTDSHSELTSSSSRDSLPALGPAAEVRRGPTTPQKQARNARRSKPSNNKAGARWNRVGGSSDDTSSDRHKAPTSQPSKSTAHHAASSPQAADKQSHHTHIATCNAAAHQGRMATTFSGPSGDSRRGVSSPRPKGREAKNTFCRNVTIYGHCRYENTCPYVHDSSKLNQNENAKKRFNVDSPSFTPLQANTNGSLTPSSRSTAISPKAANAAVFTPKSQRSTTSTPSMHTKEPAVEWHQQDFQEFVPQNFEGQMVRPTSCVLQEECKAQGSTLLLFAATKLANHCINVERKQVDPTAQASVLGFDPFNTSSTMSAITGATHQASSMNPYAQDPTGLSGASYYQSANTFQASPAYHLYWPVGPQPTGLLAYQRTAHDFFIPDTIREDLQKKAEVARQVLPNSSLPAIEQFHSLYCLDTSPQKNQTMFGYASWVYKAVSSKDGNTYALRRLENYRLTNETAIRSVQAWKRVLNANVVTVHEAFTTRAFGDSSLILVTDYHPNSKSLAEEHFKPATMQRFHGRQPASSHVPEQVLWGYLVQIASALKAIHGVGLAARLVTPSKILLTSKNRIRLNACAVLDIVQHENSRPLPELQADDLLQLGRLVLCIANNSPTAHLNMQKSMDHITRSYTARLKECIQWLLNPQPSPSTPTSPTTPGALQKDIDTFLGGIADQFASVFDSELHASDTFVNNLGRELESSRIARLLIKLNMINERPELDASQHVPGGASAPSAMWAETGERYYLKLFRDYVFHQVDANGNPVMNLAHVLDCLNKLDAGIEEKVALVSRDEQNVLIVSYREVKRALESSFQDLIRAGRTTGK